MSSAKPEPKNFPKRFYAAASVQQDSAGYCITLDGKTVKTPGGNLLRCASQQLTQQICDEWNAQVDIINTDTMPLTRLLNIALDRAATDRALLLEDILRYCDTDLVCYREPAGTDDASRELATLQQKHFTPILDWCAGQGIKLNVTEGVMPVAQMPEALAKLSELYHQADDHELAALAMAVPLFGSAVLTLALWKGQLSIEEALVACRLDEAVQAKHWGEDEEAAARWRGRARDLRAAAFFLTCKAL